MGRMVKGFAIMTHHTFDRYLLISASSIAGIILC